VYPVLMLFTLIVAFVQFEWKNAHLAGGLFESVVVKRRFIFGRFSICRVTWHFNPLRLTEFKTFLFIRTREWLEKF